jgi:membrane protein DedA with SNARE-associated domain
VGITESIAAFGTHVIDAIGYVGVFLLMTAESMVLPVPSEAVMPFAGFTIAEGTLSWAGVIVTATLGSIVGSLIGYAIGRFGGKPFVTRFGRYLLLDARDLESTDRFFQRRGNVTILVSRFIPIIRHLISIPAGMGSMPLLPFCVFTIIGAGLWNSFLAGCGFLLRKNWATVLRYSHLIDIAVVVILAGLIVLYVVRHLLRRRRQAP